MPDRLGVLIISGFSGIDFLNFRSGGPVPRLEASLPCHLRYTLVHVVCYLDVVWVCKTTTWSDWHQQPRHTGRHNNGSAVLPFSILLISPLFLFPFNVCCVQYRCTGPAWPEQCVLRTSLCSIVPVGQRRPRNETSISPGQRLDGLLLAGDWNRWPSPVRFAGFVCVDSIYMRGLTRTVSCPAVPPTPCLCRALAWGPPCAVSARIGPPRRRNDSAAAPTPCTTADQLQHDRAALGWIQSSLLLLVRLVSWPATRSRENGTRHDAEERHGPKKSIMTWSPLSMIVLGTQDQIYKRPIAPRASRG